MTDTVESIEAQIAALAARRDSAARARARERLIAQSVPAPLAALVIDDPSGAVLLGRALEWTSRDEVPPSVPSVPGWTVTKSPTGVELAGPHAETMTPTRAKHLGCALIRAAHHAESGLL